VAWPDNSAPRGIPPISSRACKPHLMTPPASQACGYWGSMRGVWHQQDRRRGPRELTGIMNLTRGKDYPMARLSGPGSRKVWHRVQELAGRARRRLPHQYPDRDTRPLPGTARMLLLGLLQNATSVLDVFHIVKLAGDAPGEVRRRVQQGMTDHRGCAYQCESRLPAYWASARCLPPRHTAQGRRLHAHLIEHLPTCPIPKIARLGVNPTQLGGRARRLLRH